MMLKTKRGSAKREIMLIIQKSKEKVVDKKYLIIFDFHSGS